MTSLSRFCVLILLCSNCLCSYAGTPGNDKATGNKAYFTIGASMDWFTKKPPVKKWNEANKFQSPAFEGLSGISLGFGWRHLYMGLNMAENLQRVDMPGTVSQSYQNTNSSLLLQYQMRPCSHAILMLGTGVDYSHFDIKQADLGITHWDKNLFLSPRLSVLTPFSAGNSILSHFYLRAEAGYRMALHTSTYTYAGNYPHLDILLPDPTIGRQIYSGLFFGVHAGYRIGG